MSFEYEIEFDRENRIVRGTARGSRDNIDELKGYGKALVFKALRHMCFRVLSDERLVTTTPSAVDSIDVAEFYKNIRVPYGFAAIVCNPEEYEEAKFFETVSRNRGIKLNVFKSLQEAEEWLLNQ